MIKLNKKQIKQKIKFIQQYIEAENASTGSKLDANANVSHKNLATLSSELNKDINIQVNRELVKNKIKKLFGKKLAKEYIRQIENKEIYIHDETSLMPYCVSISMYPFLLKGLTELGGESKAPKHINSFCGSFVNLVFAISSQFAGAVATVEFLMYFDYFARKDYGDNYLETHKKEIENHLQHVVYALNQPASARNYQSVFWNISIYDKPYFEAMFGNFTFPDNDFTKPNYESIDKLQRFFMNWFNNERQKTLLTFPVVTSASLNDGDEFIDKDFSDFIADEQSKGNSFFVFTSKNAHALSSCCRLKNDVSDNINDFSYSLGAGGVATGSINVITINMNRLIQDKRSLEAEVKKIHKYQVAYRALIEEYLNLNLLAPYTAGFISLDKQFLTIGVNGLLEGAEYLGFDIDNNTDYKEFIANELKIISDLNKEASKKYGYKFNTEFVPAENLGVKFSKWDKEDGYFVPRDCYNSYLYKVEDDLSVIDKFTLHGEDTSKFLDGGSAFHCNLEETPTKETFKKLNLIAVKEGCEYFCYNIKITICNDCDTIDKRTLIKCPKCKSKNVDYGTRVIGYLKRVSSFSKDRQKEALKRYYTNEI